MDLSGFGGNFASTLAADGIRFCLPHLKTLAFGEEETSALQHCFEEALEETVRQLVPDGIVDSPLVAEQVQDVLQILLSRKPLWEALVRAAVEGDADLRQLTALAEVEGLDRKTLPIDWNEFLTAFLREIEFATRKEAGSPGSKLRKRVGFSELFRIRCALNTLTETIGGTIGRLNAGMAEVDPMERFSDFLTEYLGRPDHPKPFGGRKDDIESLNDWLDDSGATPKLMMLAPAGRGKSALLTHWVRQLPPDIAVVFVPVSVRFGTSSPQTFLPALLARLEHLRKKPLLDAMKRSNEQCSALVRTFLKEPITNVRRLVVVVDGLDEAGEQYKWAGQFPEDLAEGVRIIVSARSIAGDRTGAEWMRRIAWDSFPERVRRVQLEGLGLDGVQEVLLAMGLPASYTDTHGGVAEEIYKLTGGDPLLVGLYSEQLWSQQRQTGRIVWNKQELQRFNEGLQGFFQRWFEDQKQLWGTDRPYLERQIRAVLTILSQALGPLRTEDVRELAQRVYEIEQWSVCDAIEPLSRFVVGDGAQQGYALTHPRLNEFFGDPAFMSAAESTSIRNSFLQWGRDTFAHLSDGSLELTQTPPYLLEHLGEHFVIEQVAADEFPNFLSDSWIESWEFRDPTFRGFLADTQRVWDTSEKESKAKHFGTEVHCMFAVGSIQSQFSLPPAPILERSVAFGYLTTDQVLQILASRSRTNDFEITVSEYVYVLGGDHCSALAALLDVRSPSVPKVRALAAIAGHARGAEHQLIVEKAFRTAKALPERFARATAALTLLPFMSPERRERDLALIVDELVGNDGKPRLSLSELYDLADWTPKIASTLATQHRDHYLRLATHAATLPLDRLFDLLEPSDIQALIEFVIESPPEYFIGAHDGPLASIGPRLTTPQREFILTASALLSVRQRLIVLSKLNVDRLSEEGSFIENVGAFIAQAASARDLMEIDWRSLLGGLNKSDRDFLLARLHFSIMHDIKNSRAGYLLEATLDFQPIEQCKSLVYAVLKQGHRNHDAAQCLRTLGETVSGLPLADQQRARGDIARRIDEYFGENPIENDKNMLSAGVELLPYASDGCRGRLALELFAEWKRQPRKNLASLFAILPFLMDELHEEATEWLRQRLRGTFDLNYRFDIAKAVLNDREFNEVLQEQLAAAQTVAEPLEKAMTLSVLLEQFPIDRRKAIAQQLASLADEHLEPDELWTQVLLRMIGAMPFPWCASRLSTAANRIGQGANAQYARILFAIARKTTGDAAHQLIVLANEAFPADRWTTSQQIELLPFLKIETKVSLARDILRSTANERRVLQLNVFRDLLPHIEGIGGTHASVEAWDGLYRASSVWP